MRRFHKILGLTLLLPFVAWAITGVFFFMKPGYQQAYQSLVVKSYPLESSVSVQPNSNWQAIRWQRSILGNHLMVKAESGWQQLDPITYQVRLLPSTQQIKKLVTDAIAVDQKRYGKIVSVNQQTIMTDQQIEIELNWEQLTLRQKGPDTDFINRMYKIHYLQWTGIESIDRVLGLVGLAAVLLLALIGVRMAFRRTRLIGR